MKDLTDSELPARKSSAQSRELGAELRQIRRTAGYRANKLAEELGWSQAKVSKLERGWRGTSSWDIATLLGRCGVDKLTRDRIMRLVREPQVGLFLRTHKPGFPDALICLDIHEPEAVRRSCYEPVVIPTMLQTSQYASALLEPLSESSDELCSMVKIRANRQSLLQANSDMESVFYIREQVLDLMVGGAKIMHDQMKLLAFACGWEKVALRLIPAAARGQIVTRYPATLLNFSKGLSPLGFTGNDVSVVFAEAEPLVDEYRKKFAILDSMALSVEQSCRIFEERADGYGSDIFA